MTVRTALFASLFALLLAGCGDGSVEKATGAAGPAPPPAASAPATEAFYGDDAPVVLGADPASANHGHGDAAHSHDGADDHDHEGGAAHEH